MSHHAAHARVVRPGDFSHAPTLAWTAQAEPRKEMGGDATQPAPAEASGGERTHNYKEISDFFNIREANSNVTKGEWEFEITTSWETKSDGSDDDLGPAFSLKYGITDMMHAEIEVETLNLGDGGNQGNGELALLLFNQWWNEAEILPAFDTWAEVRIPSGQGSSKMDAELHFDVTKTLFPNFRAHFNGFIESANGHRGGEEGERRGFQWGVGPGFDYSFSEATIATVNYLMRSGEEAGSHNLNILEFGMAQQIAKNQHIKLAVDVGLDGQEDNANVAAKLLWSIEW